MFPRCDVDQTSILHGVVKAGFHRFGAMAKADFNQIQLIAGMPGRPLLPTRAADDTGHEGCIHGVFVMELRHCMMI